MIYEIHLYVPKTGQLTPSMLEWLFENGQSTDQPERFWPVRKIKQKALARRMLQLDATLVPLEGPGSDIELHYPNSEIGIVLYIHDRGVILFFPYMIWPMACIRGWFWAFAIRTFAFCTMSLVSGVLTPS
jgi:hypothetical protein